MPQAEFDLLNAQLGLSFDPFLSFDFGTASTSNYPLGWSGSVGGDYGMNTSFNEQAPACQPPQLQHHQAVPGPSNYYQYQAQSQDRSRTAAADESASGSKTWDTGRNYAPPRRANPNRVDLDDDEASSEDLNEGDGDEDATYDPFDDPIYLRYVTLEQAERLLGT